MENPVALTPAGEPVGSDDRSEVTVQVVNLVTSHRGQMQGSAS